VRVAEQGLPARRVLRKAAGGQHHAAPRPDTHGPAFPLHKRAAHRAALLHDQLARRR
jgi:hypothetical protein